MFSSGNERTKLVVPAWGFKNVGYKIRKTDKFAAIVDLMNENMEDKTVSSTRCSKSDIADTSKVYLTLTYDFVDGNPKEYDDLKPIWLDVAQCLTC